jgi:hypothetical protein
VTKSFTLKIIVHKPPISPDFKSGSLITLPIPFSGSDLAPEKGWIPGDGQEVAAVASP